jgi:DNA repair exonuclease SbcCD ATPase subunit
MIQQFITRRAPLLAAFALIPVLLPASTPAQQLEAQKEGIQLVAQIEESARNIRTHATHLDSLAKNMQVSRHIHKNHLTQIREAVNDQLRPALQRLVEIQAELPDWKQQSIQDMHIDAAVLAANVNSAIQQANDVTPTPPAMNREYQKLVSQVHAQAASLVNTSDAVGEYSSALLKAQDAGVTVPQS